MKKIIVISYFFITSFTCMSQDVNFLMDNQNPIYSNPAFTGTIKNFRFVYAYRNENFINFSMITHYMSADQYLGKIGGVGLSYLSDTQLDIYTSNIISINYAKSISLGKNGRLSFGASGSLHQENIDLSKLSFGDYFNLRRGFIYTNQVNTYNSTVNNFDFNLGFLFYQNNFYFGYAAHHITQPNISFFESASPLTRKHVIQTGFKIKLNEYTELLPIGDARLQDYFIYLSGMLQLKCKWIIAGVGYGDNSSIFGMLGVTFDQWRLLYSYGYISTKLTNQLESNHEISLQMLLNLSKKENKNLFLVY